MKLSAQQQKIYDAMEPGEWYSSYGLKLKTGMTVSLATLNSLVNKKLLLCKSGIGSQFTPHTVIKYLKPTAASE